MTIAVDATSQTLNAYDAQGNVCGVAHELQSGFWLVKHGAPRAAFVRAASDREKAEEILFEYGAHSVSGKGKP